MVKRLVATAFIQGNIVCQFKNEVPWGQKALNQEMMVLLHSSKIATMACYIIK